MEARVRAVQGEQIGAALEHEARSSADVLAVAGGDGTIRAVVQAANATSHWLNAYNRITLAPDEIAVENRRWDGDGFGAVPVQRYRHSAGTGHAA